MIARSKTDISRESGATLAETLVALAVLGTIAVVFLGGLFTTSKVAYTTDELSTAASLAQLQTEWVKDAAYLENATPYSTAPIPDNRDYIGYSVTVTAEPVHGIEDGIQRITVRVKRLGQQVFTLESYKVDR